MLDRAPVTARAWGPPPSSPRPLPDDTRKPGHQLRADLRPVLDAFRSLVRGLDREGGGRLSTAIRLWQVRQALFDPPRACGLRYAAAWLRAGRPLLGRWTVAPPAGGRWTLEDDGSLRLQPILALPVIDWTLAAPAACPEILALDPADPARWWALTGNVTVLGERNMFRDPPGTPIELWRHPLDWLRAGGERSGSACLLFPSGEPGQGGRPILLGDLPLVALGRTRAEAEAFGHYLKGVQQRLRPKLPPVLVPREATP